jgi:hypothetical protein
MSASAFQALLEGKLPTEDIITKFRQESLSEDIELQINETNVLFIKGQVYEERAGRIVQLKEFDDGKIHIEGLKYQIKAADVTKDSIMFYDVELEPVGGTGEIRKLRLDYRAVLKMVKRKTSILDLSEDHDLVQTLNDVHEDAFTINGKQFYIAGEQWTQTKPGYRDLVLIPVGRTGNTQVIKTVSEKLIKNLIETGRSSFRLSEEGDEPDNTLR